MTILNLNIGNVTEKNDGVINGAIEDVTKGIKDSIYATTNVFGNTAKLIPENITQTIRHPWQTIFNKSNWGKLARTVPVVGMDVINKAKSLPFRTLDLGIQYVINNNLERIVGATKSVTTGAVANILRSKGANNYGYGKFGEVTGNIIEGTGDLVGSIIKAPTGLVGLGANKLNKYVGNLGLEKTDKWANNLRVSDKDYFNSSVNNSGYNSNDFQDVNFGKANMNTSKPSAAA